MIHLLCIPKSPRNDAERLQFRIDHIRCQQGCPLGCDCCREGHRTRLGLTDETLIDDEELTRDYASGVLVNGWCPPVPSPPM